MVYWSEPVVSSPPAALPVEVDEVRAHCRADTSDDGVLGYYLDTAIGMVEAYTGVALITRTVTFTRSELDDWMSLPVAPIQSVDFAWLDANNTSHALDTSVYAVTGLNTLRPEMSLLKGKSWPSMLAHPAAVTATAIIGYGLTGTSVPAAIRHAIRLLVGDFYMNREDTIAERGVTPATLPNGVTTLLANYRIW